MSVCKRKCVCVCVCARGCVYICHNENVSIRSNERVLSAEITR